MSTLTAIGASGSFVTSPRSQGGRMSVKIACLITLTNHKPVR